MKLYKKNIEKSIRNAEKNRLYEKLNRIYDYIPHGICKSCTKCCRESVNTFYIEFLNIYEFLLNNPEIYNKLLPKIFKYYFLEMIEKMKCPFLDDEGKCYIYEVRPLSCRLFGHWDKAEYENNYKRVLKQNKQNYKYFKNAYGIKIPKEIINNKIEYCNHFESQRKIFKEERQSMIDNVFTIESDFFMKGLITEEFIETSLVSWFIYTAYDMEEAGNLRVKVMREYIKNGESDTLEKILDLNYSI